MRNKGLLVATYELNGIFHRAVWDISVGKDYLVRVLKQMGAEKIIISIQ